MNEQVRTPRTHGKRNAIIAGIAGVALAAGAVGAGVVGTGAWFTASKSTSGNTIKAGTLTIGDFGGGDGANTPFTASGAVPLTDAQALENPSSWGVKSFDIPVKNTGDIAFDWSLVASHVQIAPRANFTPSTALDLAKVKVAYKDGSGNWQAGGPLNTFFTAPPAGASGVFAGSRLAPGETKTVSLRVYLDSTADDSYQGAAITFDLAATGTQSNKVGN